MNEELIKIYSKFKMRNIDTFFDELISFMNKNHSIFSKYILKEYLEGMEHLKSKDMIFGHNDENLEKIVFYSKKMFEKDASNKNVCTAVISDAWDLCKYKTDMICPVCAEENMVVTVTNEENEIVLFCEECLHTEANGKSIKIKEDEEIIPANRKQIEEYMDTRRK